MDPVALGASSENTPEASVILEQAIQQLEACVDKSKSDASDIYEISHIESCMVSVMQLHRAFAVFLDESYRQHRITNMNLARDGISLCDAMYKTMLKAYAHTSGGVHVDDTPCVQIKELRRLRDETYAAFEMDPLNFSLGAVAEHAAINHREAFFKKLLSKLVGRPFEQCTRAILYSFLYNKLPVTEVLVA